VCVATSDTSDLDMTSAGDILGPADMPTEPDMPADLGLDMPADLGQDMPEQVEREGVDILFVVDNSGSMCQEQRALGDASRNFLAGLGGSGVDAHIALTTTHAPAEPFLLEPLALEGRIQSRPQALPSLGGDCLGNINDGFAAFRDTLDAAIDCMQVPDTQLASVSNEQINCAVTGRPSDCIGGALGRDANGDGAFDVRDIAPQPSSYREIPDVLRTADYMGAGGLDVTRMHADLQCMILAGTRGFGIEKGLQAAVAAVSPELTGGSVESPSDASAPNHGFIRSGSRFALVFATDENDCSHDGAIDETNFGPCGANICDVENTSALADGASKLTPISTLADRLRMNLAASKGSAVSDDDIFVASLHGTPQRYSGAPTSSCNTVMPGDFDVCASPLGTARSGDRYQRFMGEFTSSFPAANAPNQGLMCQADLFAPMSELGTALGSWAAGAP